MNCSVRESILPKANRIVVNGVTIPHSRIALEIQNHPSDSPVKSWANAARALVVRQLLLQEADRIGVTELPHEDGEGRRETQEEASIRALIEREVIVPEADRETCRRYYEINRRRFRSADIFEAAHILISAAANDPEAYGRARETARALVRCLTDRPEMFAELARVHSACPSAAQDGNLGQISSGQTTPEFARALALLAPGVLTAEPVATRYGFHIIRLDRKIEGNELPFEAVAERIANYLTQSVRRRAIAQYIARLAASSHITGIEIADTQHHRVH